jgi:hypothetical protein
MRCLSGTTLRMSHAAAGSRLRYARAMRERLPQVGEVFAAGDIDYRTFATMVCRTDLITDSGVLAAVEHNWPSGCRGGRR